MSGISIIGFAVGGLHLAAGLGSLLALDPAEAAARNDRIRHLTAERRDRRRALELAAARAVDDRERLAQAFIAARVDAAGAAAALAAAGLPPDPHLVPPSAGAAVAQWCRSVPAAIRAAYGRASAASAEHAVRQLLTLLPNADAGQLVDTAGVLRPDGPDPAPSPVPDVAAVLTRMLASLDPRTRAVDRHTVDMAAQAVVQRADRTAHLVQLRLHIQEANDRVARQRDDAVVAAQLLDAIEPYRPAHGLDPDLLGGARAALADVVAGRRDLDDVLLDRVARLREQVEARASATNVTDALSGVLGELGYLVGPDFSVGEAVEGMLEVSHPAQPDHLVRMRIDAEHRQLVAMVYRAGPAGDNEKADAAAEAAWCGVLDKALAQLAASGLELTPVLLTPPGSKPTPVATGTAQAQRTSAPPKYRTNKRSER